VNPLREKVFLMDFGWTNANIKRIAWHALVVAAAAVLTYLLEQVLPQADFGINTPFIVAGLSFILKSLLEGVRRG
jgi:hypothetical protein